MGSWRYQPVWTEDKDGERIYSIVEVHFDEHGRLDGWTENTAISPMGDTIGDLKNDLTMMLMDAYCWRPVAYESIKPGMHFQKLVSKEDRNLVLRTSLTKRQTCLAKCRSCWSIK